MYAGHGLHANFSMNLQHNVADGPLVTEAKALPQNSSALLGMSWPKLVNLVAVGIMTQS